MLLGLLTPAFAETTTMTTALNSHITSFFFCTSTAELFSSNARRSLACDLSAQIQYSEDRCWTILTQAGQRPICLNWSVKAHGIASVPSIRFHSTKAMRHIHVLKVSKCVFELGSGCSSEQILTFSPKSAFHSISVAINITVQTGNEYTKVKLSPKPINLSE